VIDIHLVSQGKGMQDPPAMACQTVQLGAHPLLPRQSLAPGVPLCATTQEL
jgi:hypothetical protein